MCIEKQFVKYFQSKLKFSYLLHRNLKLESELFLRSQNRLRHFFHRTLHLWSRENIQGKEQEQGP
jgi:hypothetical protein